MRANELSGPPRELACTLCRWEVRWEENTLNVLSADLLKWVIGF